MIDTELVFDGTYVSTNSPPWAGVAITTTRVSSNVLNLLAARDIGIGNDIEMHVVVTTAFVSAGGATLTIDFETCATAGGSYLALNSSPTYAVADLKVGAPIWRYTLPINQALNDTSSTLNAPGQYIRLTYTVGTSSFSAGAVLAFLTGMKDRTVFQAPANNFTVYAPAAEL